MKATIERTLREGAIDQAMQTIDRRVNELGVTEPSIARQSGEEILVQMPGVSDVARAKDIIGQTAILEFKLVEAGPAAKEDLQKQYNGNLPGDLEIIPGTSGAGADAAGHPEHQTSTSTFMTGPPPSASSMPRWSASNGIRRLTSGATVTAPEATSRIASSQSARA